MVQVIEFLNHRQRILSDKKIQLNCLTLFMENKTSPGVHFIKYKCWHFKCQNMAFKCQKWCLTFRKIHKTILAFKAPKCDFFITNIMVKTL